MTLARLKPEALHRFPRDFSEGQHQSISIARALAGRSTDIDRRLPARAVAMGKLVTMASMSHHAATMPTARPRRSGNLIRPRDQPAVFAADTVHMPIGNRDRGRRRDHVSTTFPPSRRIASTLFEASAWGVTAMPRPPRSMLRRHDVLRKLCIHKIHRSVCNVCATPCLRHWGGGATAPVKALRVKAENPPAGNRYRKGNNYGADGTISGLTRAPAT